MPKVKEQQVKKAEVRPIPLIGHGSIAAFFDRVIAADRLVHAYLFIGPEQVGKSALARVLAGKVLGSAVPLERHPDFLTVERGRDAKSGKLHADIVLDQIHSLRGWLSRGAFMAGREADGATGWKVVVLDGAQYLNKESANALLKSLEEPKDKTLIILLTETADGVFPTIRSRCQIVSFGRVRAEVIARALSAVGVDQRRAELLARLSGGCPGRALEYLRDDGAYKEMLARREVLMGLIEAGISERWSALERSLPAKLPFNETVAQSRKLLDLLSELLRDGLLLACGRGGSLTHDDLRGRLEPWAARVGRARIAAALQELNDARKLLDENVNPRAVMENLALFLD